MEESRNICFKYTSIQKLKHIVNILVREDINQGKDEVKKGLAASLIQMCVILKFEMELFQTREDMTVFSSSSEHNSVTMK